jgi:hypothetical protein
MKQIKICEEDVLGTSFYGYTITTSYNKLKKVLGPPTYENEDKDEKTQFEWAVETLDGIKGYIYDWKEYRKIKKTADIIWHIGGKDSESCQKIKDALNAELK